MMHLGHLPALEVVNLYGTGVTDAGLQHLANLKHLKKIFLWQSKVTENGAKQLRAAIPGVEVILDLSNTPEPDDTANKNQPAKPSVPDKS
jgi:hypothetical protein